MAENDEGVDVKAWFPSFLGKGYDPIVLEREPLTPPKGNFYPNLPDVDRVQVREIPSLLSDRLDSALRDGHLATTYSFYLKALERADVFDSKTLSNLKSLKAKIAEATDFEEQTAAVKTINKYLKTIKTAKR